MPTLLSASELLLVLPTQLSHSFTLITLWRELQAFASVAYCRSHRWHKQFCQIYIRGVRARAATDDTNLSEAAAPTHEKHVNNYAQNSRPSSLAVTGPATLPEPEPQPQPERLARGHSVSSMASEDYSIDSRSSAGDRDDSVHAEPIAEYHWCACELPAQGLRFLRAPLPDDVSQLTLCSYQNSVVIDGEGAVAGGAAAVDKPEEQPSVPLGSSTSAGNSTPDGNDAATGAPRRDSAEGVGASESRPPAQAASAESDPLCAHQTHSASHAAPLSEEPEPSVMIAPLPATGAAGQPSGAAPGDRVRPPLPTHLSLNLVAQLHRMRDQDENESFVKAVLSVLFLVCCTASVLLLLYFFYDVLGVCRLRSALEPRLKLTSHCTFSVALLCLFLTLLYTAVYVFFGFFLLYAGIALTACAIKLLDLTSVPQPKFFFYR